MKHSDINDAATELETKNRDAALASIREQAAQIEPGTAGECAECGYYYKRIVRGLCARCRDDLGEK